MLTRKAPKQTRDELGRRLCRRCKVIVPKGLRSYCSPSCRREFEIAYFPSYTRRAVFERDGGICDSCKLDTEKLHRIADILRRNYGREVWHWFRREMGLGYMSRGSLWQADHVVECVRGGWGMGLENFRTLCTRCHKAETARLARELASERRQAMPADAPLFPSPLAALAPSGRKGEA